MRGAGLLLILLLSMQGPARAQSLADEPSLIDLEAKRNFEILNLPSGYFGRPNDAAIQAEFAIRNEHSLRQLESDHAAVTNDRVQVLTKEQVIQVFESLQSHPVASKWALEKYKQEDTDIGYCFGRATYYHLLLLRLGLSKESMRKVWVLANIQHRGSDWGHHVALTVRGVRKGEWWVIDPFLGQVLSPRDWMAQVKRYTRDPMLRLYTTEAAKFSLNLGVYDPVQMGLRLRREADWYQGFFGDLLLWFRKEGPESLGLKPFRRPAVMCAKVHG